MGVAVALVRARAVAATKPIAVTAMAGGHTTITKRSSGGNDDGGDGDGNGHSDGNGEGNEKRRKQRRQQQRQIKDSNKDSKLGMHLEAETSPLPWHSVLVAMTVRRNRNDKKYTAQPPPIPPIVQLFCCRCRRLL